MRDALFITACTALVLVFLFTGCGSGSEGGRKTATEPLERLDPNSVAIYPASRRAEAQDFTVTLLNGDSFQLSEQRGKVVVLNIWATWCAPCHTETPDLVDLYETYRDEGLVVLGVSLDDRGESVVRPFMEKYGVTYPIYIDRQDVVMDKYGPTMAVPTTYILGKKGEIRYFATGALTRKELEPRLRDLLQE
ncbi:MAG: TlpA disulfide reductase family protein [Balneolaceae bacterium]|nr:TlpA disulfide reductase family protein [Balneolaceae bacterium]